MMLPITPEFVYLLHKEKEKDLQINIDQNRAAREQAAGNPPAWFTRAAWWKNGKRPNH